MPRAPGYRFVIALLSTCYPLTDAWAYRPFVSTDAAVADPGDVEVELGAIGFRSGHGQTSIVAPTVIGNLGIAKDLELVGEFKLVNDLSHHEEDPTRFEDTAVSLKWIAHEGVLQEHGGSPSIGVELSLLVPTLDHQHRPGGELVGIMSGTGLGFTYHLNGGVLTEPSEATADPVWGVIIEHVLGHGVRAVAEVNGESATGTGPDDSALLGAIWDVKVPPPIRDLAFDVGIRRGFTHAAAEWGGTAGFTIAFPVLHGKEEPP
jgi:hypothetical protein